MTGPIEVDPGRIAQYADLTKAQLKRQTKIMKENQDNYSPEELRAAALAWQKAFPGQ